MDRHIFRRKIVVIFRVVEEKLQGSLKQTDPQSGLHAITDQIKCIRLAGDTLWDRVLVLQREDQLLLRDAIAVFVNICFCRIHSPKPRKLL